MSSGGLLGEFKRAATGKEQDGRGKKIAAGRENFREYCNLMNPSFFRPERKYQDEICNTLQAFYERRLGDGIDILILNLPPGFGKSYSAAMFSSWIYGKNIKNQVIEVSYNQTLSIQFSKAVRDLILDAELSNDPDSFVAASFFPGLKIKQGDSAMERWSLEGSYNSYLATSFDGSITGMRGTVGIIDDPIKNAYEAMNDAVKDKHWDFYKNTFSSRILSDGLQIVIQTRWATDDLAGRLIENFPERCHVLEMRALDEDTENGVSLCEDLYSTADLQQKRRTLDAHIWSANYMQVPVDIKGALYGEFKTYRAVDADAFERRVAYVDTADEGADSLCAVMGGVIGNLAYVTDIYYTDEGMEVTEPETARRLNEAGVRDCLIESNNGGRGFARNVAAALKALKCKRCVITWFHQSKNKKTRILVNATNVMEQVIMPEDWKQRWPGFAKAITTYQRKGKNAHDDAPDGLTGFVEMVNGDVKGKKKAKVLKRALFGI